MVDPAVARHFGRSAVGYSRLRGSGFLSRIRAREQAAVRELATVARGAAALDAFCSDHPVHAERVRRRVQRLARFGLLEQGEGRVRLLKVDVLRRIASGETR